MREGQRTHNNRQIYSVVTHISYHSTVEIATNTTVHKFHVKHGDDSITTIITLRSTVIVIVMEVQAVTMYSRCCEVLVLVLVQPSSLAYIQQSTWLA